VLLRYAWYGALFIVVVGVSFVAGMLVAGSAYEAGYYGQYLATALIVTVADIVLLAILSTVLVGRRRRG
jgi:uncharacterized membrane protein